MECMRTEVAALLIDIEAQLRQLNLWEQEPPPAEALLSSQPFCIDTLTLPQWLQFIFVPRLYQALEQGEDLPARCAIAPIAEEYFLASAHSGEGLLTALRAIDRSLSTQA